jgi:HEPN domain-containing protein
MNRIDFQQLAELRLREARALFEADFPEGAYYLAGYAVECALKACIAKRTQQHDFPDKKLANDSHTHDLSKLLNLAGLSDDLEKDIAGPTMLEAHWEIVRGWSEQSRYDLHERDDPERNSNASVLIYAVGSEIGGVLRWIKQYW